MKVIVLITFLVCTRIHAQPEFGLSIGGSTFLGDVGGNRGKGRTFIKDVQASQVHPAFRFSFSLDGIALSYLYTTLSGADSTVKDRGGAEVGRLVRGFYFSTPVHEFTISGRKYFGPFFLTAGFGALHFETPQTEKKVPSVQPLVLYGAGFRYPLSTSVSLDVAISGRKLFTDYIDGVSKRGDPKQNDSYITALAGIAVRFEKDRYGCPKNIY